MDAKGLKTLLEKRKIKPSFHRLQVLKILEESPDVHATADDIYSDLSVEIPTLSKATIYNTLSVFVESGLVRELVFSKNECRYELDRGFHGHFICDNCKAVYDVSCEVPSIEEFGNFDVHSVNVTYSGLCSKCK